MESIHLLNVRIDNLSSQELLEDLTHGVLVTPNIDDIMKHQHDKEFHEYASQAEFSICDSKVVKLMSSIAGKPLKEAIPGSSFSQCIVIIMLRMKILRFSYLAQKKVLLM